MASLVAQQVKNPPTMRETWVRSLGWEDPLEKGKATHSSILAWRIPWTVQSTGSQRVQQDWATFTFTLPWNSANHGCWWHCCSWSSWLLENWGPLALVKGVATHSSILAGGIPWTEEVGGLQSMGSLRVEHDWVTNTFTLSLPVSMEITKTLAKKYPPTLASMPEEQVTVDTKG